MVDVLEILEPRIMGSHDPFALLVGKSPKHTATAIIQTAAIAAAATDVYPGNPTDGGSYTVFAGATLAGTDGKVTASDFVQEKGADCWAFAEAAANPELIANNIKADGTGYVVTFNKNGTVTRVHVTAELPTWFAPVNGAIIGGIWEKAYAYFRNGTNTYSSLDYGWPAEATAAMGILASQYYASSEANASTWLKTQVQAGNRVVVATIATTTTLVPSHAYSLTSLTTDSAGVLWLNLRNPWGFADAQITITQALHDCPYLFSNVPASLLGDANGDGRVDAADFNAWFKHLQKSNATLAQGDFNGDGRVDAADFDVWFSHVGA